MVRYIGTIAFQHLHGLGIRPGSGPESLWNICQQNQDYLLTVILVETLEVLVPTLEVQHEEMKLIGLMDSWAKIKCHIFGNLLDEAIQFVRLCDKGIEILDR